MKIADIKILIFFLEESGGTAVDSCVVGCIDAVERTTKRFLSVGGGSTVTRCTVRGFRGSGQEPSARISGFYDVCCFKCGLLMDDSFSRPRFRLPSCFHQTLLETIFTDPCQGPT